MWNASDEALVAGFTTGDGDVARVFVNRFQDRVYGLALAITRDRQAAQEVAQDAFLRAWRYGASYDPRRGSVTAWLLRITRNVALDHVRTSQRRLDHVAIDPSGAIDDPAGDADVVSPIGDLAAVADGLRSLPAEQRETLMAAAYYGLTTREISEAWDVPLGTVKTRLRLALAKLRDLFAGGLTVTAMDCTDLADVAPELALEILGGAERAAALAHLEDCVACQQLMDTLAADADRLLMLAPSAEPPVGFQDRVLTSLTRVARPVVPRARHSRRAVALLGLAACFAALALALSLVPSAQPAPAEAAMRTAAGEVVGHVFVHREPVPALFMTLPGWSAQIERYAVPDETYALRIERSHHAPRLVPFDVEHDSSWGATLDVDPDSITSVAVVDSQGHVWCQAEL